MCATFLNFYSFETKLERAIWELHSEGFSPERISEKIRRRRMKANKDTIYKIITRLEAAMNTGKFFGN